jgi:hypothetical protein
MDSPLTLRTYQKNIISRLLPPSSGTAEQHGAEGSNVEPSSAQRGSGRGVSADDGGDVLAKPTFATQLVLGCYVATQKAAGMYTDLIWTEPARCLGVLPAQLCAGWFVHAARFVLPAGATTCMRGTLMKGKFLQLHALERAVLSQQQQLMQIRAQTQRVVAATRSARKEHTKATQECSHQQQLEKRHRSDAEDLKGRILFTKARFLTSNNSLLSSAPVHSVL